MKLLSLILALMLSCPLFCMQTKTDTGTFTFQPLIKSDLPLLFKWFAQPYIAALWKEPTEWEKFEEKFAKRLRSTDTFSFIAGVGDKTIGYIQYHLINDADRALFANVQLPVETVGLDLFIGEPSYLDKGYGTKLLRSFMEYVKKCRPLCKRIIIDPAPDNHRAIKCYEKVGFKVLGTYHTPYGPTGSGPGNILLMSYDI